MYLLPWPDVNECTDHRPEFTHNCGDAKLCRNNEGSFTCKCKFGYKFDSKKGCTSTNFEWTPVILGKLPSRVLDSLFSQTA